MLKSQLPFRIVLPCIAPMAAGGTAIHAGGADYERLQDDILQFTVAGLPDFVRSGVVELETAVNCFADCRTSRRVERSWIRVKTVA